MPVFQLSEHIFFPPPELARADGLLAVGGDLSPERLLLAYQMGIFPWYSEGDPILWWSPTPRLILEPHEFHLSRRLARAQRKHPFRISLDQAFRQVMEACAAPRPHQEGDTWINAAMMEAYCRLHELGYAHSIECWQGELLAGGLYGVAIGGVFFGESMFSRIPDSSKAALHFLSTRLAAWNFHFIDCQMRTDHLLSLGAKEIPAPLFFDRLQKAILMEDRIGKWTI